MVLPLILFALGVLGTLLLTPLVIQLARQIGAMDEPGERKVHDHPVPRLGGAAIFGSFALASLLALALHEPVRDRFLENAPFWLSLAAGATLAFLLGLYDDVRHASVWTKFAVQTVAALIVMFPGGVRVVSLANPFDGTIQLGWLWIPLTALWIVGVTNALNLIDGLDGLAGGVAFISAATLFAIAFAQKERLLLVLVLALLAGSLLGFLRYNFHPAKIFLGDCGSMFLGYLLAVLSVVGSSKRTTALALLIPILILGIPVFDTLNAMARRLGRRVLVEKQWHPRAMIAMFSADRAHIHHALLSMGYTHKRTVLILYGMAALFGALAFAAAVLDDDRLSLGLMLAGLAAFVLMKQYGKYVPIGKSGEGGDGP
jgi:UDP-GlcNAc:undecaprenyl-phosphate GlcNAc-1-phosphate transferase